MNYEPPTHLDLFSGIGGFSLAFESVGFKTIGFSEIDHYASAVLKKHWPDVPNYGDIRNVPTIKCDVLTGGFPCQPFSVAGKQRGKSDDRYLWPAMLEVIERCRPTWILGENVPGIISMELDGVLSDLEGIGYAVQAFVVPACAVDAEHQRDRLWIIANLNGERKLQSERSVKEQRRRIINGTKQVASNSPGERRKERMPSKENNGNVAGLISGRRSSDLAETNLSRDYWNHQPVLGRGIHGLPNRAHRIKCLGNSIVPQVAQVFAKAIYQSLTL